MCAASSLAAGRGGKAARGRKFKPGRGGHGQQRDWDEGGVPDPHRFVTTRPGNKQQHGSSSSEEDSESESSGPEEQEKRRDSRKQAAGQPAFNGVVWEFGCTDQTADKTKEEDSDDSEGADELLANSNRAAGPVALKIADLSLANPNPSRREREEAERKRKEEHFWRMQEQGKTDQARADLARLAIIRKRREEAAAKKAAEQAERASSSVKDDSLQAGKSIIGKTIGAGTASSGSRPSSAAPSAGRRK